MCNIYISIKYHHSFSLLFVLERAHLLLCTKTRGLFHPRDEEARERSFPFASTSQHGPQRAKFATTSDDVSTRVLEDAKAKKQFQIEKRIASSFPRIQSENIVAVLHLLRDECTIPFIARYRKGEIGFGSISGRAMSEVEIKQIKDVFEEEEKKEKCKEKILRAIEEMLSKKSSFESSDLERREREKIEQRAREDS